MKKLVLLSVIVLFSKAQVNFPANLKAFYPMNGDYYNAQGNLNLNHDFYTAAFATDTMLEAANAGSFNGSQRVNLYRRVVNNDAANFTIEFWFRTTQNTNGVFYWEGQINQQSVWIRLEPSNNRIFANVGPPGNFLNIGTTAAFNDGYWHHYALTGSGSNTLRVYIDGVLNNTATGSFSGAQTTNFARFGCRDDITQYYNGRLDNVKIWNTALSASEINGIYNSPFVYLNAPVSASICSGSSMQVPFTVSGGSGAFQPGNVFYAQLSDLQGRFKYPLTVGTLTATGSGNISLNIPAEIATGVYKVRILATNYPVCSTNTQTISIVSANAFPGYDIYSNLVIHNPFNGNVNDVSGNNITGTPNGSITYTNGHLGNPNSAILFNGSNTYIALGNQWPINMLAGTTQPISISFWINQLSTPSQWGNIFSCWDGSNGLWAGTSNSGNIRFRINNSNFVEAPITNNNWIHVVCVYNGSNIRIYLNGTQATAALANGNPISIAENAEIGRQQIYNNSYFHGALDEFKFYERALTANEVKILYNGPSMAWSNSPICSGNLVFDSPNYAGLNYSWAGPNSFASSIQNPTISPYNSFVHNGTYTLQLTLNGCPGIPQLANVTNTNIAPPTVLSTSVCPGSVISATASGAMSGHQYYWFNDAAGSVTLAANSSTYSQTATTSQTIYAAVFDGSQCFSGMTAVTLSVHPQPTVSVSGGTICLGKSFTISPSGANTYTISGGSAIVSPTANTIYSVTGTNVQGCISVNTATLQVTVNPTPGISVSANINPICSGQSSTLTVSGATSYTWSNSSNSGSITVSPASTSNYSVVGSNLFGCSASTVITVTVNALPTVSISGSSGVCSGNSITLTASGASTYTWSNASNSPSITETPLSNTNYTVYGTGANGCQNFFVKSVSVYSIPIISSSSGTICSGNSFNLNPTGASTYTITGGSALVSPTTTTQYSISGTSSQGCISSNIAVSTVVVHVSPTISVNSGSICSGGQFTITPTGATTYTISGGNSVVGPSVTTVYSVTGTSSQGCLSSGIALSTVVVTPLPVISVNSGSICLGQSFTINPSGAATYTIEGGNSVVSPSISTSYTVTGTSTAGCVSANSATSSVTVYSLPVVSLNSGSICPGQSFIFTPTGANNYSISGNSFTVNPLSTQAYTLTGVSAQGCQSQNTASATVVVFPQPTLSISSSNTLLCLGQSATLTVNGANTYTWSTSANGSTLLVNPVATTIYTVTGTDGNGCEAQASITQQVENCTNIKEISNQVGLIIYPNPAFNYIQLACNETSLAEIYDLHGKLIASFMLQAGITQINTSEYTRGMYTITIYTKHYKTNYKLILQ